MIIVIDATEGVTEQDAKIAGIAHDRGKGIIIAVNKWDAIEKDNNTVKKHTEKIRQILSFMPYAEILFISAKSGQRLNKIFDKKLMHFSYTRYLENRIRDTFGFRGTALKFITRERKED